MKLIPYNRNMSRIFLYLPVFLLPLGCIGVWGGFQVVAFLSWCYLYKNSFEGYNSDISVFFLNKDVKHSIYFMALWIISMMFASIIVEPSGIKQALRYVERMVPFFLIGLFSAGEKRIDFSVWLGICCSAIILDINTVYSFFIEGILRPPSFLGSPNKLGGFFILILPFIIAGTYKWSLIKKLRNFGTLVILLTIVALLISGSRGAYIGLLMALIISFFIMGFNSSIFKFKKFYFSVIISIIIGGVVIYFLFPQIIFRVYDGERILLWQSAIKIFWDYPIFGVGTGNFNQYYLYGYISPFATEPSLGSPHNIFLHYLVEFGVVGAVSFILLIFFQLKILYKNMLKNNHLNIWILAGLVSVLGMCIHGMVDTQITSRIYALMYWFLYGFCCYEITREGRCK